MTKPQTGKLYDNLCCQGHMAQVVDMDLVAGVDIVVCKCQNPNCYHQGRGQEMTVAEFISRYRSGLVGTWGVFDHSDNTWWIGFDGDLLTFANREEAQEFCDLFSWHNEPRRIGEACVHPASIHVHTYYSPPLG